VTPSVAPSPGARPVPAAPAATPQLGAAPRPLTLHLHPLALVPRLAAPALVIAIVVVLARLLGASGFLIAGVLLGGLGALVYRVVEWRTFVVTLRYDRINVRHNYLLFERQTTYSLPGFQGLSCEQGLFGRLWNMGTLVLIVRDQRIRLSMLTPYSAVTRTLGW
jgi:uncharacterized membrane protein YdbT with pleckstrin-like domain